MGRLTLPLVICVRGVFVDGTLYLCQIVKFLEYGKQIADYIKSRTILLPTRGINFN